MRVYQVMLLSFVCLALVVPAHAWRRWRFRGRRIINNVKGVVKGVGCKALYGVACPAAVGMATSGVGTAVGATACSIGVSTCKRNLVGEEEELQDLEMVNVPFDGDFEDYDDDKDGLIDFAEFYDTVTSNIPLKNPAKLGEVFNAADVNGDGKIDQEEFAVAPLDFGDN